MPFANFTPFCRVLPPWQNPFDTPFLPLYRKGNIKQMLEYIANQENRDDHGEDHRVCIEYANDVLQHHAVLLH
jgi:hypothetical protein